MKTDWRHEAERTASARRILVLGPSGAGKSFFTKKLSRILDIEPIHLDALFWQTGFKPTDRTRWRKQVRELVTRECWLMDGTYESTLDVRLPAAELVIYVDERRHTCLWRAAKRMICDREPRTDCPLGHRLDLGLLRYIWRFGSVTRPQVFALVREQGRESDLVILGGWKESACFLPWIEAQRADSVR